MRLQQILINLVGNALKFTEKGRVIVTVDMEERTADEALLHITVADTGIGVPQDRQSAIFEAFTQADGSTARSHGGTGLGLTISRRFVEMMGGRLWLESLPQRGSTFHFTLKIGVRPQAAEPVRIVAPAAAPAPAAALNILLAEDNRVNQFLTVRLLEKEGHRVEVVVNGRAALAALDDDDFDLALMDLQMPEMDGFETTAIIRGGARSEATARDHRADRECDGRRRGLAVWRREWMDTCRSRSTSAGCSPNSRRVRPVTTCRPSPVDRSAKSDRPLHRRSGDQGVMFFRKQIS
jgi:hypothetical protein